MSSPDRMTCGLACSKGFVASQERRRRSSGTYCAEYRAVCNVAGRNDGCTTCLTDSVCDWVGVAVTEVGAKDEQYHVESRMMHGCGMWLVF